MNARRNAPMTPGDGAGSDVDAAEDIARRGVAPAVTRVRASTAVRRSIFLERLRLRLGVMQSALLERLFTLVAIDDDDDKECIRCYVLSTNIPSCVTY